MNDIKILLVDDDDVDAEMVIRGFKKSRIGNDITVAEDGFQALSILRENGNDAFRKPFIVLLDLNMPRMNGFDFLEELRNDENLRDSIVFVLTTSKADVDRTRSYEKNIAGYIVKSEVGPSFTKAIDLLKCYWTTVTLPT
ncbi:response regulator [Parasedimentitalea marina]|uniref:Response regulator n=1 Tax=Parasedimentitalea marina TaxID=2483033 RepID=A0A3T0N8U3_9RHOB|nr:response regulator [Parasedimentitalea marina]AZV80375.1 response regulator [Parasedimentitalea marina]